MANRTHTGFLLVVLVAGLASCEGASPSPTAPSTAQPQQPPGPAGSGRDTYSVADGDPLWRGLRGDADGAGADRRCPCSAGSLPCFPGERRRYRFTGSLQLQARVGLPVLMGAVGGYGYHYRLRGQRWLQESYRTARFRFSPPPLPRRSPRLSTARCDDQRRHPIRHRARQAISCVPQALRARFL